MKNNQNSVAKLKKNTIGENGEAAGDVSA